jgi:hypothetical protein
MFNDIVLNLQVEYALVQPHHTNSLRLGLGEISETVFYSVAYLTGWDNTLMFYYGLPSAWLLHLP